jgi:hypothetical protein
MALGREDALEIGISIKKRGGLPRMPVVKI